MMKKMSHFSIIIEVKVYSTDLPVTDAIAIPINFLVRVAIFADLLPPHLRCILEFTTIGVDSRYLHFRNSQGVTRGSSLVTRHSWEREVCYNGCSTGCLMEKVYISKNSNLNKSLNPNFELKNKKPNI